MSADNPYIAKPDAADGGFTVHIEKHAVVFRYRGKSCVVIANGNLLCGPDGAIGVECAPEPLKMRLLRLFLADALDLLAAEDLIRSPEDDYRTWENLDLEDLPLFEIC